MLRIGLTGGIGAGKSVARARFEELGAATVDYDVLARDVVEPGTAGLAAVADAFGTSVLAPDGSLDRAALAGIVFADEAARRRLERIVHPEIDRLAEAAEREARDGGAPAIVHDIPLLAESGRGGFDLVVVVEAPVELRLRRLIDGRDMAEAQARARIAAQADDEARTSIADEILDGSGSPRWLREQVDALWRRVVGGPGPESGTRHDRRSGSVETGPSST